MEFNASKPIFETIKEHYAHLIDIGGLVEGTEMPSVREVALANGINPNTVQRAFSLLVEEGYLVSIPKKGFFVSKRGNSREALLDESINKLLEEGFTVEEISSALLKADKGKEK